ncbi:NAD(P)/FAD-dependent oxidoreductase [Leeuwenhoekiella marinoflava]|uniref:Glycine/D-amino acid oxidase-like deaminating enzyme n=2 Tax=Leeuwenhoekiella marinoflava TaxID=988 RepID=A0A4Q0PDV7_9FLAO|nr:FAD-dependent oxidoreductase [Leeuwenhoekiella marinoflava]RXG25054.1 glycine/D-amino acid oxidase-like deaminating enzyme [Leeuwenhoekiella marinoflava]SHF90410.1 Glycine/D-amino acid oxidase [Leeuwenhoekiella marinoflava DSM 3653]
MKEVDYLIVGLGLAGMAFCDKLEQNEKSFFVIDKQVEAASRVAAGLINPVILKRYTLPWQGEEQFDLAKNYFKRLDAKLGLNSVTEIPVYKIFSSAEDQNNWFEASDKSGLDRFLKPELKTDVSGKVYAKLHAGEVKETIRIDISKLLDSYKNYLIENDHYKLEAFDYDKIEFNSGGGIEYNNIKAKRIVFAEGFGVKANPFFNKLPLVGNKGEYVDVYAPELKLTQALKSTFFIIPLGDDIYKVGATFNWNDKDCNTSLEAREELVAKLKQVISCEFDVVKQEAAVRPTTGDRRPLLGVHPKHPQLAILNGLGTRGTMMGSYLADKLYNHIENGEVLEDEISILRFPKKF